MTSNPVDIQTSRPARLRKRFAWQGSAAGGTKQTFVRTAPNRFWSGQRLASNVGGALDLDEYADAGICADMRLLARQQQLEDGVMDGPLSCNAAVP